MAQGFFNNAVMSDIALTDAFSAISAGLYAFDGQPASRQSIEAMHTGWNIDISGHRARNIGLADMQDSCILLAMTAAHKYALIEHYPNHAGKIFTLKEYISDMNAKGVSGRDISDPFGQSLEVYRICAAEIKTAIDILVQKLKTKVI